MRKKKGTDIFSFLKIYLSPFSFLIIILILPALKAAEAEDLYDRERERMVRQQIEKRGISHTPTLNAMRRVPRHLFVPERERQNAYSDRPLPIGYGQTISQPYIVAYMTEIIDPGPKHRVLEIGTGSGYQAAALAEIVAEVYTVEIIPRLGETAAVRLAKLGYGNVKVKIADGYYGWKEHAPFDAIVVTAAAEHIPPPLIEQLKDGGKMVIPVGSPFFTQHLMLVEKQGKDVSTRSLMPVQFVPFRRPEK